MKKAWNKGIKMTEATKRRIGLARKGKPAWNKGKKWSNEIKDKISNSRKGRPAWNRGRKWSEEIKGKIRKTKLYPESKFKKLYDELEVYFNSKFKLIDEWLISQEPKIELINSKRGVETLPTYIRHCFHHKEHGQYNNIQLYKAINILNVLKDKLKK